MGAYIVSSTTRWIHRHLELDPFQSSAFVESPQFRGSYDDQRVFVLGASSDVPDRLDEPMILSLADRAALQEAVSDPREHVQWELRKALDRIHEHSGNDRIGGPEPADDNPFDGMDPYSSAMLVELAQSVMPSKPVVATGSKYTPDQRRAAIRRWRDKRSRRHLISQTKYKKMKDVAVGKARCKGGKFISKAERARMAAEEAAMQEAETAAVVVPPAQTGIMPVSAMM